MNVFVCGAITEQMSAAIGQLQAAYTGGALILTAGVDVSRDDDCVEILGLRDGIPMIGGERIHVPAVRLGHKERFWDVQLIDRSRNVVLCTRTTRRAARRARGRAKACRRAARRGNA